MSGMVQGFFSESEQNAVYMMLEGDAKEVQSNKKITLTSLQQNEMDTLVKGLAEGALHVCELKVKKILGDHPSWLPKAPQPTLPSQREPLIKSSSEECKQTNLIPLENCVNIRPILRQFFNDDSENKIYPVIFEKTCERAKDLIRQLFKDQKLNSLLSWELQTKYPDTIDIKLSPIYPKEKGSCIIS